MAPAPSKWIPNRQLNSLTAIAKPIYQHAHGPRTVTHLGSKIPGADADGRTAQDREAVTPDLKILPAARRWTL